MPDDLKALLVAAAWLILGWMSHRLRRTWRKSRRTAQRRPRPSPPEPPGGYSENDVARAMRAARQAYLEAGGPPHMWRPR
jgi:predicted alpha/beta-hydrolase family hydrolase